MIEDDRQIDGLNYSGWEKIDLVHLNMVMGLGPETFDKLIAFFKTPDNIIRASRHNMLQVPGLGSKKANSIHSQIQEIDPAAELEKANKLKIVILGRHEKGYPEILKQIPHAPLVLYRNGADISKHPMIAIVGSRRCTYYGRNQSKKLAGDLTLRGFTVVSGLARGIDRWAHWGALQAGGITAAVVGTGLDNCYPKEHLELQEKIIENGGAIYSELPMGSEPGKGNFPRRNRIIAGLCAGIVVIEANIKSGALITARYGAEYGKEIFSVPGNIDSPLSRGTNSLIQDGANMILKVEDIMNEFTYLESMFNPLVQSAAEIPQLEENERIILDWLSTEPVHIEAIIEKSGLNASQTQTSLLTLELKGIVEQLPGKRFAATL